MLICAAILHLIFQNSFAEAELAYREAFVKKALRVHIPFLQQSPLPTPVSAGLYFMDVVVFSDHHEHPAPGFCNFVSVLDFARLETHYDPCSWCFKRDSCHR